MLYDAEKKQEMLDTLNNRVSSIVDVCVALAEEGYIPNKNKYVKLEDVEKALRRRIDWGRSDVTKKDIEIRNECLEAYDFLIKLDLNKEIKWETFYEKEN